MAYYNTPETNGLKKRIEEILKHIPEYVTDNNELKINLIKDKIDSCDSKLIEILLKDKSIKKAFFCPVLDSYVFKSRDFKDFLDYSYACNSYSKYLGKEIGLYMGDTILTDRNEVVLNFPFKDCVLEGGQKKEDGLDTYFEWDEKTNNYVEKTAKRREVFYNEVLAQDEIDSLFSPKAFSNCKKYSVEGEEKCSHLNRNAEINKKRGLPEDTITDNLIIKGNNLLALHSLKEQFAGKIKLIYIDPPYNTGNDTFSYNDNFNHSSWLTFMKNRLEIARELLTDDGAIYMQLDFNEVHYAKVLMDEIFGVENFQREIIWRIGWVSGYKTIDNNWIRNHDTILFYSKNKNKLKFIKKYIYKKDFKNIANTKADKYPIEDVWNGNEYDDLNSIAIVSFAKETVSKLLNKNDEVKGQKSEKLLKRIIEAHIDKGDIVLDLFGGTGTTAAVAHKLNAQYIICEQLDEHIDILKRRLQEVIKGDNAGISKQVNWKGGGDFIYLELAEKNERAIKLISACKNLDELISIFDTLCNKYFLHYNVKIKKFRNEICNSKQFKNLSLERQKEMFIRMLDLNQLYVNFEDRNDESNGLSTNDILVTEQFYNIKKVTNNE